MPFSLDPWPAQPYEHGGQSVGNTAYRLPVIANAQALSFWLHSPAYPSTNPAAYLFDARDLNPAAYWVSNEAAANGLTSSRSKGAQTGTFGFAEVCGVGWTKVYLEAAAVGGFAQGVTLLSRYTNSEFLPGVKLAQVRVHSRPWTALERADPRGNGPADALLAVYDFSDVSGGLLKDVSGNARHAAIIGPTPTLF
jgi:hypothetical protein